jgi:hypothetical protein
MILFLGIAAVGAWVIYCHANQTNKVSAGDTATPISLSAPGATTQNISQAAQNPVGSASNNSGIATPTIASPPVASENALQGKVASPLIGAKQSITPVRTTLNPIAGTGTILKPASTYVPTSIAVQAPYKSIQNSLILKTGRTYGKVV